MGKYDKLWEHVQQTGAPQLTLTLDEAGQIACVPIDHSFLQYKKELPAYGYEVGKISLKNGTVQFRKLDQGA